MKPGRELDALIAEKVMGIPVTFEQGDYWPPARPGANFSTQPIRPYSTDIAAAWEVVEKVGRIWNGFTFMLEWEEDRSWHPARWRAGWVEWSYGEIEYRAEGTCEASPAHAICLAALNTIGAKP